MTRRRVGLLTVLLLAAGLCVWAAPSSAHQRFTGSAGLGCTGSDIGADSTSHGFFYDSGLSTWMRDAVNWSRSNNFDPTIIDTFSVPVVAVDTDVVVYDQDYATYCGYTWHPGTGLIVLSLAKCISLAANNSCEKNEVRFDESWTIPASQWGERGLACHELGHTLGLSHTGNGSCMDDFGDPAVKFGLTTSEIQWINANYP